MATVSASLDGWEPVDVAAALDSSFGIAVRSGLHCAPLAHRTIGTFPRGTVRLSPGPFSTDEDIDQRRGGPPEAGRHRGLTPGRSPRRLEPEAAVAQIGSSWVSSSAM